MATYHKSESLIDDEQIEEVKSLIADNANDLKIVTNKFDSIQPVKNEVTKIYEAPDVELPNYQKDFNAIIKAVEELNVSDSKENNENQISSSVVKNLIYKLNLKHQNTIDSFNNIFAMLSDGLDTNKVVNTFEETGVSFEVHTLTTGNIANQYVSGVNVIGVDAYKKNAIGVYVNGQTSLDKNNLFDNTFYKTGLFYRRRKTQIFIGTAINNVRTFELGIAKTLYEW